MPKQVIVQSSIEAVEIIETPIPTPKEKEVVIRVSVASTNPKDWKYLSYWNMDPHNSGDDLAGIVHSVGKDVYEFKPGDRVAAFHEVFTDNGAFAEYAVAPDRTTFHILHNVSLEEAATIPLAALTAAIALYSDMKLPPPWALRDPAGSGREIGTPLVIYGVFSAVGAFGAKFARLSGLSPIIGIAGRASSFAETLVDRVVDYRQGEDAVVKSIKEILNLETSVIKAPYVFDAISENGSFEATARYIDPDGGIVSTVLSAKEFAKEKENFKYPPGVKASMNTVPQVFSTHKDFGYLWSRYTSRLLQDGRLTAHPFEIIPGGLNGVLTGLQKLRDGEASAVKYVYRISDTQDFLVGQ